jgi:phenylalanine-4-hydroxylase
MSKYSYERILETVPVHLQSYVVDQKYNRYMAQDQAVWRYIMRKNLDFLSKHAHHSYIEGLETTGISPDKIPDVEEMNEALDRMGWRAVVVNGFIPPAAFMEFQAHKILVISAEIRTIEHILYTPAPDIVHEAAGHAPIIADQSYAEYLQKFGEYGSKAMASKLDFEVYEAIRHLSIIKEYPDTSEDEIKNAEADLNKKIEANKIPSEAALLSRLHWWTVEYGLIGTPTNFKQYGAGLLSSVGESQHCLNPEVTKIPFSINCIDYNYDITTMQPQLFVTEDWHHLIDVLEEFASSMCFRKGGMSALKMAIESENVSTLQYSSGLQVSGVLSGVETGDQGEAIYLQFTGPSALAYQNIQITGHGTNYHKDGFGSPVGKLSGSEKPLELFNNGDLEQHCSKKGNRPKLIFSSGIVVEGEIEDIKRNENMIQLISFKDCQVKDKKGEVLFKPEWGTYDMAVGEKISSVFAGTADKENYNVLPPKSEEKAIEINYTTEKKHLFSLYQQVRDMRENVKTDVAALSEIEKEVSQNHPEEWLLHLEIIELVKGSADGSDLRIMCMKQLEKLKEHSEDYKNLIIDGLTLLNVKQ